MTHEVTPAVLVMHEVAAEREAILPCLRRPLGWCSMRRLLVHTSQKFLFLTRIVAVAARFDFPLASKWWHLVQCSHRILHFGADRRIVLRGEVRDVIATRRSGYPVNGNHGSAQLLLPGGVRHWIVPRSSSYPIDRKDGTARLIIRIITARIVRRSCARGWSRRRCRVAPSLWPGI